MRSKRKGEKERQPKQSGWDSKKRKERVAARG